MPALALEISLYIILPALLLLAMSQAHSASHGTQSNTGWIAWLAQHTSISYILGLAARADRWLISKFASAQLKLLAVWFSAFSVFWRSFFDAGRDVALATATAVEALARAVPRIVRQEVAPVRRLARRAEHVGTRALQRAEAAIHALDTFKARVHARLHALEHAISVTLPHEIGQIRTREKELERVYDDLRGATRDLEHGAIKTWEWLRTHRTSAAMGAFAGAVLWALSRVGYGFLRCRSWQRLGRSLTCNDANILAQLLADATLIVGAMSIYELAKAEQEVIGEAAKIVRGFWEV